MLKKRINKVMQLSLIVLTTSVVLTGCSDSSYEDIKLWMKEQNLKEKGHIKPLPPAKEFMAVPFIAKSDPFKEKPLISLNTEQNKYTPNPDRRKEPLESYQLENLKMTGVIIKDRMMFALITTPDSNVHYVTKNNYLGSNYGKITDINESQIILDERIKNASDEWEPRKTIISLEEVDNRK